jgi:hypothetical protein
MILVTNSVCKQLTIGNWFLKEMENSVKQSFKEFCIQNISY